MPYRDAKRVSSSSMEACRYAARDSVSHDSAACLIKEALSILDAHRAEGLNKKSHAIVLHFSFLRRAEFKFYSHKAYDIHRRRSPRLLPFNAYDGVCLYAPQYACKILPQKAYRIADVYLCHIDAPLMSVLA